MVLITWKVPKGITAGIGYANFLEIVVAFEVEEATVTNGVTIYPVTKKWISKTYSKLNVGENMFVIKQNPTSDEWDLMEDLVRHIIDEYFTDQDSNFIINPN
jgi:hypothetical protein